MRPPNQAKDLVLYADDDQDDLDLLAEAFSSYTHLELLAFSSGVDLLAFVSQLPANQKHPCLIILDINMPILNGWETLGELKKLPGIKDCFVLFFSTSALQIHKMSNIEKEVTIVTKPASLAEMEHVMTKIIRHCPAALQAKLRVGSA